MMVMAMIGAFVQCMFQICNIMIIVCTVTPMFFVFILPARMFFTFNNIASWILLLRGQFLSECIARAKASGICQSKSDIQSV